MHGKKVRAFTLLEVVVCVALLAILAGAFAWKGNHLVQHHMVRSSAKTLVREIEAAHVLSLSYQTDIAMRIIKKKGDFFLEWQTAEPCLVQRCSPRKLRGVRDIRIDNKSKINQTFVDFTLGKSVSCKYIDLQGKGNETCRIEFRQGKPLRIHMLEDSDEDDE